MNQMRKLIPLGISYIVLLALSVMGPFLSLSGGDGRGHWAFLFMLPLAIGCLPYSFICGEVYQAATRSTNRTVIGLAVVHGAAMLLIAFAGLLDILRGMGGIFYFLLFAAAVGCGLFFWLGAFVMRHEQRRADARYGVSVRRDDPWASFFNLQWEGDGEASDSGRRSRRSSGRPERVRAAEGRRRDQGGSR